MPEDFHPSEEISFDEKDSSRYTPEAQEHFFKAMTHHAGHGEHPGRYSPLRELIEETQAPPDEAELAKHQPMPPEEALPPQPPLGGGKGRGEKPPSQGTPTAIGHEVVAPPPAGGEF